MSADKIALEVRELHAFYGKSHILQGVNLHVKEGEIVALQMPDTFHEGTAWERMISK